MKITVSKIIILSFFLHVSLSHAMDHTKKLAHLHYPQQQDNTGYAIPLDTLIIDTIDTFKKPVLFSAATYYTCAGAFVMADGVKNMFNSQNSTRERLKGLCHLGIGAAVTTVSIASFDKINNM